MSKQTVVGALFVLGCCAMFAALGCAQERISDEELRTLILTAQSGAPTPDIVRRLARSNKPVPALLAIAVKPGVDPSNREIAIAELAKLKSEDAADALAQLLVPHHPYGVRHDVAEALQGMPCSARCVRSVLFYLYRFSQGEQSQRFIPFMTPEKQKQYAEEDARVVAQLEGVLAQHSYPPLDALVTVYGVGSAQPSEFGIRMMRKLNLRDGCQFLSSSERIQKVVHGAQLEELTSALTALGCR